MPNVLIALGPMRILLLCLVLVLLPFAFFTDTPPEGFGVVTAYVVPSVVTILFFVLLLDALVNRVFMSEKPAAEQIPHRTCIRAALGSVALLGVFWAPYYIGLIRTYVD